MERFFNCEGPIKPEWHYYVPMLERFATHEVTDLVKQGKYFVMHAPRQTGKTSCLLAYMDWLNMGDEFICLYVNVELAQGYRDDVDSGMSAIARNLAMEVKKQHSDSSLIDAYEQTTKTVGIFSYLLSSWCQNQSKPVVLLLDEVDALVGDTLVTLLRELRTGYSSRPRNFPQSIILCGVRDIRDYRITTSNKEVITGGSAFNIKSESLTIDSFSIDEVHYLYEMHTIETGQQWEQGVINQVMDLTAGQPWLVNAIAYEACWRNPVGKVRSNVITMQMIVDAKEQLIYDRRTHIDQLIDKLKEPRVRRVIEPILTGESVGLLSVSPDDIEYVKALGLITQTRQGAIAIANEIYREVIPRELAWIIQPAVLQDTLWYVLSNGSLDINKLLGKFQEFFRENSEIWLKKADYTEFAPQIILMAWLQRVVNGGGEIIREYALGMKRLDILVKWKLPDGNIQKEVLELKILRSTLEKTLSVALPQTLDYMDKCGVDNGHLLIFDRRENVSWDEKIFKREEEMESKRVTVWGM